MSTSVLSDIKVVEIGQMVSAPYCGKLLADLGADVIKVELPDGDRARLEGPFPDETPHPEKSALFLYNNTNKRSISLDLNNTGDQEVFKQLIQWADVLLDNHPKKYLEGLGFDWDVLHELNPMLVYTSITPYGRTGPRADCKGDELTIIHAASLGNQMPARSADVDQPPTKMGGYQVAYHGGIIATLATLAAVLNRDKIGGGELIDISLQESLLSLVFPMALINRYHGTTWGRVPDRPPAMGRMQTSDGYAVVGAFDDHHFRAFRELMGKPSWAADDKWDNRFYRMNHIMDIAPQIENWMLQQSKEDLHHKAAAVGIPNGPVNSVKDVLDSPQYKDRKFFVDIEHPVAGTYKYPGWPFKSTAMSMTKNRPAPQQDQHRDDILKQVSESSGTSEKPSFNISTKKRLPLDGVRVVDFNWVWAGPYSCMSLASLGAEVIKVEGHSRSDLVRRSVIWPLPDPQPRMMKPNQAMSYNAVNLNKKSLTLDLSQPEAVEIAKKLVMESDIVMDNMRPGAMKKLGLGYEALKQIKPDIIGISLSSRGYTGPESSYLGFATIHQAVGGLAYICGHPDGHPTHGTQGDADLMNGLSTALYAVAALHHRDKTGEGQFIEYSQCEGVSVLLGEQFIGYQMTSVIPERQGNRHPTYAPHSVYRAWGVDRWLALEIHSDEEFAKLAEIIQQPELSSDERFATMAARKQNETELDAILEAWIRQRDRDWMANEFSKAGLAAAPSRDGRDIYADPHLRDRGSFIAVDHPELGELEFLNSPWRYSSLSMPTRHSPLLGEHNEEILGELLGYSQEEIAGFQEKAVIMPKNQEGQVLDK